MRDRIERFVLLPFSMGCVSESSIAVGEHFPNRLKHNANSTPKRTQEDDKEDDEDSEDDEENLSDDNLRSPLSLLAVPKFQRLFRNFKNFSQLFVYKDDEMEEEEFGMEIGLPTDIKHVTHIGIDGSATSILSKGWENLKAPNLPALPSVHAPRSALAMPAEANTQNVSDPQNTNQEICIKINERQRE